MGRGNRSLSRQGHGSQAASPARRTRRQLEGQEKLAGKKVRRGEQATDFFHSSSAKQSREQDFVEFDGLNLLVSPGVYAPREDSALLARAVQNFVFGSFLDLGCGSGIQSLVASSKNSVEKIVGVDINGEAIEISRKNAESNRVAEKCSFLQSDLFSAFEKTGEKFDCIGFNPPYLPTNEAERLAGGINSAFDGGTTGRKVMDEFISQVKNHLSARGIVLLVSSSLSSSGQLGDGNGETRRKLESNGFEAEVVAQENFFFEQLVVFKAV